MKNNPLHLLTLGTVFLLLAIWVLAWQTGAGEARGWFVEGGVVETLTAACLFIGTLMIFGGPELSRRWPAAAMLLMFGLRELDFHDRFTSMNISKSRFYLSPDVPFAEKLFGLCVLLFFMACLYLLFKRHGRALMNGLRRLDGLSVAVATALLFLVLAKSMDGLPRKLKPLGISMDETSRFLATAGEELLEMGAAILLLICAIAARKIGAPPPQRKHDNNPA